jgi:molybdate transport system substrate-binding protein
LELTVAIAIAIAFGGCGENGDDDKQTVELTVSAASSLTGAFEAYGETTDVDEKFSFAGSDDLAAQIREGAPVDVFASANTSLPDALYEEGLVEEPTTFIANALVLAVPQDSPLADEGAITGGSPLEGLADTDGIDVVIGAEGVPVGDYTRETLSKIPDEAEKAILADVRSEEPDVKSIVAKLTTGAADAGFVYASDVDAADGELIAVGLPDEVDPVVEYGVAIVSDSENPAAAQEFIDGLLEGAGREALLDAGFLLPKGVT